jgi:hypothetical protein
MDKKILASAILAVSTLGSAGISNAATLVGIFNGNDGTASQLEDLLLNGTDIITSSVLGLSVDLSEAARVNWDFGDVNPYPGDTQTDGGLSIEGTVFKSPPDDTEAIAGNWSWTGVGTLDYLAIKFDTYLAVISTDGDTSGTWSTDDWCTNYGACIGPAQNPQAAALSHATGYQVVPVPAAVWLFGTGLLGLVGIARRKQLA